MGVDWLAQTHLMMQEKFGDNSKDFYIIFFNIYVLVLEIIYFIRMY